MQEQRAEIRVTEHFEFSQDLFRRSGSTGAQEATVICDRQPARLSLIAISHKTGDFLLRRWDQLDVDNTGSRCSSRRLLLDVQGGVVQFGYLEEDLCEAAVRAVFRGRAGL